MFFLPLKYVMKYFSFYKVFFEIFHTARYYTTMQENKTLVSPLILLIA